MPQGAIKKVVIAGGGTAGWMTAAWFSKILRDDFDEIVLVESEEIGTVGVGEATTPYIHIFNRCLGIDEDAFVRFTKGTFKLGIEFVNWGRQGHAYHHSFGPYGREYGALPFHAIWLRHYLANPKDRLENYSLQSLASLNGRFMRPTGANSPLAEIAYAYHFDASLYARFLRSISEAAGAQRIEGKIQTVKLDAQGAIESLCLTDGRVVDGDLFIDCTGFRALLLGEALGVGYIDWSKYLPCDRAIAVPTRRDGAPAPFTRSTALSAGWQWRIPLQHRDGNGHVFSSAFMDETKAMEDLFANLGSAPIGDPRPIRFTTGRRETFWKKNCIAVGLSAGFLEPLESTSIMLIQNAILRLQYLFPDKGFSAADTAAYNAAMVREYEDIRDFLILHYKVGVRQDSEFWRYCHQMDIPDGLQHRIDLFSSRGRIPEERGEQFRTPSWLAVMVGQGLCPAAPDPLTLSIPSDRIETWLSDLRSVIGNCLDRMPMHADFIARHCRTDGLEVA
ncbi:tryptophan halogenase family protein [Asticcacaulis sp. 201]|uniref:tryptophan halogenase family protein n=1 Tax=Asticcacaulis sp. 201 TaxID=3028787 RepID=UPI002916787B|nr:tryptophan halogenase family protein [Asticcacaulis sp. 201]MDV6330905.1 tryptophan halogenase family protein [Asticcacaulis sp. 201]